MRILVACALAIGACAPALPRVAEPPRVLVDTIEGCPRVAVDRAGHTYSVTHIDRDEQKLVVASLGPAAWSRELVGKTRYRAVADAHLGDGIAFAASGEDPVRGMFVVSMAPDGTERFERRIAALGHSHSGDVPKITSVVLGPHSEVTIAGATTEALDFGDHTLDEDADTTMFVEQYSRDGNPIFGIRRRAQAGTIPRLVATADGRVVVAYTTREGRPMIESLDAAGQGTRVPAALPGRIEAMVPAGADDVVVATRSGDTGFQIARITHAGLVTISKTTPGEFQDGALGVRSNGDIWFGGWFDGPPGACSSAPSPEGVLPSLVVVSADGRRCRSLRVATRESRWETPASLVESGAGRMLFATTYLGDVDLPEVPKLSAGSVGPRCAVMDLPADAPAYSP